MTTSPESHLSTNLSGSEALTMLDRSNLEALLAEHQRQLAALPATADTLQRARVELEIASDLLALQRAAESWPIARRCFDAFMRQQHWQEAVECCDVIYQCEQSDAVIALGNGVWLAVTFPIAASTSVAMLQHIIDASPANSDGAAVAAATAHYIADLRGDAQHRDSLMFLTTQIIAQVAKNHSQINSQDGLDVWMERLQLNDPAVFIPRLGMVIEAIVEGNWWFDRDALRALLPE